LVEGDDGERRSLTAVAPEDGLVVFDMAVAGGCDDYVGDSRQKALEDFDTNQNLPDTGKQGILVFERCTGSCDLV